MVGTVADVYDGTGAHDTLDVELSDSFVAETLRKSGGGEDDDDRVHQLPGAPALEQAHYAGFVSSNASVGNHIFYWFMESSIASVKDKPACCES